MEALAANDLCAVISFDKDMARMEITDIAAPMTNSGGNRQFITITSPMSTAALKGCHEVQNLGAVQSYLRRYLWVAALEIVEHDAIDSSAGKDEKKAKTDVKLISGKDTLKQMYEALKPQRKRVVDAVAASVIDHFNGDDLIGAYEEYIAISDSENDDGANERAAVWYLLPSNIRTKIKDHGETLKEAA